jgi:diaminopimelate decarboxylase
MDHFEYKNGSLFCEDVSVEYLAEQLGTPLYVYSKATLRHHYNAFAEAFSELNPNVCFAVKSLSNIHILKLLSEAGAGFDVVSGGEISRLQVADADMSKVVYSGVAKTDDEIRLAIACGIGGFNVESEAEFENISRIAEEMMANVRASLRVNPDVYDRKTHTKTTTGKKGTKFGVDIDLAVKFFETYAGDPNVTLDGIDLHIGSPIYSPEPYVNAVERALELIETLKSKGIEIRKLDIGGGYAADYEEGASPLAADYAAAIVPLLKGKGLEVELEPGRQIACNAGILLTRTQYIKQGVDKRFVIVDAAMTDLIRPALYDSQHFVWPAKLADGIAPPPRRMDYAAEGGLKVDVVGGVCESSDFLCKDRVLPPLERGDLVAVFSAGAYGFVMSSQYNSRPRAVEVLVDGEAYHVIRRRETYEDLYRDELNL